MSIQRVTDLRFKEFSVIDEKYFKRYANSGIPQNTFNLKFSDFVLNPKAVAMCKNYVQNFPDMYDDNVGILFSGDSGTGKTMLACIIAKYISALYGKVVTFTDLNQLIQMLDKSWVDKEISNRLRTVVTKPTLLVIDDFPETSLKSRDIVPLVHRIIKERSRVAKPLIITTKMTERQLVAKLGEDLVREILENSPKVVIKADENYREIISRNKLQKLADF